MASDRRRILELALESLLNQRKKLDEEIAQITRELRGGARGSAAPSSAATAARKRKPSRFSKEERLRRAQRMRAYWENWRKKKK